jgi:hypothetical protein
MLSEGKHSRSAFKDVAPSRAYNITIMDLNRGVFILILFQLVDGGLDWFSHLFGLGMMILFSES